MDKAPKGATHFLIGDGIVDPWRDLSGPTWKWFYARGERWVDTEETSTAFIDRNAHRLQDLLVERDSAVADAAQWLWNNRRLSAETNVLKAPGPIILEACRLCKGRDTEKAAALDWTVVDADGAIIATPSTLEELARLREELARYKVGHERLSGTIEKAAGVALVNKQVGELLQERLARVELRNELLASTIRESLEVMRDLGDRHGIKRCRELALDLEAALKSNESEGVTASPWRTDTPPYDVMLLVEFADSYGNLKKTTACYVEQAIFSITPHGSWYSTQAGELVKLHTVKRWMEIPA